MSCCEESSTTVKNFCGHIDLIRLADSLQRVGEKDRGRLGKRKQIAIGYSPQCDLYCLQHRRSTMEGWGIVAFIMCCGLFADGLIKGQRIKALQERLATLEEGAKNND